MHHLVQHRVLDFGPGVPSDVPAANRDLVRAPGLKIDRELAEPAPHAARESDRNLTQSSAEISKVELAMHRLQPVEQGHITRASSLSPHGSLR
jgi:hypothetical protein